MIRTYTNEDGVFIHAHDLADAFRRESSKYDGDFKRAFEVVGEALDAMETKMLREAVAQTPRSPFMQELQRLLG